VIDFVLPFSTGSPLNSYFCGSKWDNRPFYDFQFTHNVTMALYSVSSLYVVTLGS